MCDISKQLLRRLPHDVMVAIGTLLTHLHARRNVQLGDEISQISSCCLKGPLALVSGCLSRIENRHARPVLLAKAAGPDFPKLGLRP